MFLTTTERVPGAEYTILGLVRGSSIQTKDAFSDFIQGFVNIVGGEMSMYTQMMDLARNEATERMVQEAEKLYADAVVSVRYTSSEVAPGAAEVMAYGTAVKFLS